MQANAAKNLFELSSPIMLIIIILIHVLKIVSHAGTRAAISKIFHVNEHFKNYTSRMRDLDYALIFCVLAFFSCAHEEKASFIFIRQTRKEEEKCGQKFETINAGPSGRVRKKLLLN